MKNKLLLCFLTVYSATFLLSCASSATNDNKTAEDSLTVESTHFNEKTNSIDTPKNTVKQKADAATILSRKQVPVICYHQVREWRDKDSKSAKDIITSPSTFRDQIKMLADSGFTSILPDQLYDYLLYGKSLPENPVMITFDDNDGTQFSAANPIMKEFGFKGVYFIMTVTIDRPGYMSKEQLKELSDDGNVIASHTWDHHNVQKYEGDDWEKQIDKPSKQLEKITGKKVEYFAFPFGLWNEKALKELESRGMKASFILSTKRDSTNPMQTIRRIIGSGYWSGKTLNGAIKRTFEDGKG